MDTKQVLENTIKRCREKHIIIPTYKQMRNPELIPEKIKDKLKNIGLWDLNSLNLFRITWKNEPVEFGGGFGNVNFIELPSELTGVKARIIMLIGKFFPTGAHKVGATAQPLVEKLVTGRFDPPGKRHYGRQPEITAVAVRMIHICSDVNQSPYCPKVCQKSGSTGFIK